MDKDWREIYILARLAQGLKLESTATKGLQINNFGASAQSKDSSITKKKIKK